MFIARASSCNRPSSERETRSDEGKNPEAYYYKHLAPNGAFVLPEDELEMRFLVRASVTNLAVRIHGGCNQSPQGNYFCRFQIRFVRNNNIVKPLVGDIEEVVIRKIMFASS